ncbi:MAG: Pycsar system effector family protein [Thermoguttaceae bacterium]|jgi:hypothetical protein
MTEPARGPQPAAPSSQISICLEILDDIQEQIRFADQKAGFVSVLNVFLFGFIATNFDKLRPLYASAKEPNVAAILFAVVVVSIYLVFTAASFLLVVSCVMSRFGKRGPRSRVFFGDIAARYGADHARYVQDISAMTDAQWVEELGNQVVEVSRLAIIKHRRIRWATMSTLAGVMLWLVALVTVVSLHWIMP